MNGEDDIGSATDQPRSRSGGWPVVDGTESWPEPEGSSYPIEVGPLEPYVRDPYPHGSYAPENHRRDSNPQDSYPRAGYPRDDYPRDDYPPADFLRDEYQTAPRPGSFQVSRGVPPAAPPPPPPVPPPSGERRAPSPPPPNGRRFDPLTDEWPIIATDRSGEQPPPPRPPAAYVAPPTARFQPEVPAAPPPDNRYVSNGLAPAERPFPPPPLPPREPPREPPRALDATDPLRLRGYHGNSGHQAVPPPPAPPRPQPQSQPHRQPPPPLPPPPPPRQQPQQRPAAPGRDPDPWSSAPRRRPSWVDDPEPPEAPVPPRAPAPAPAPEPEPERSYTDRPDYREAPSPARGYDANGSRGRQLATGALLAPPPDTASRGWRKLVFRASGGTVNPGPSPEEVRHRRLIARIRTPLNDCHRIAVMSLKGGVGKTTTTVALGSTLASHRGDRVVAIDANPDRGTLGAKVPRTSPHTVRELLEDAPQLHRYVDVRQYLSQADSRLEVLASANDPEISEAFQESDYRAVDDLLQMHYSILLTDCGTGILHDAMHGVLSLADTLVIVSSSSADGGASASATLDWLEAHGYYDQVRQAVSVISMFPLNAQAVDVDALEQHFAARTRRVVRVPYDPHLAAGGKIVLAELRRETRRAYREIAGAVAERFDS